MSCDSARSRLAEGPFCAVDACSCGTWHVSIGAITLRLSPEVATSIASTLRKALSAGPAHCESAVEQEMAGVDDEATLQLVQRLLDRGSRGGPLS